MASLTRKRMDALGVSPEAQDEIMSIYQEVISEIKTERDTYKAQAAQLETVTAERDALKNKLNDPKQAERVAELEKQVAEYQTRETNAHKRTALTALLESAGIDKRGFARVLAATDLDSIELDGESIKDAEKLTEKLKADWADLLVTDTTSTAQPATPPNTGAGETDNIAAVRKAMGLPEK